MGYGSLNVMQQKMKKEKTTLPFHDTYSNFFYDETTTKLHGKILALSHADKTWETSLEVEKVNYKVIFDEL